MITIDKTNMKDLRGFRFCIIALSPGGHHSQNKSIEHLHIKNGKITATDGRRLHQHTLQSVEISDGLYGVVKNTKTKVQIYKTELEIENYPDFERVWPNDEPEFTKETMIIERNHAMASRSFCALIQQSKDPLTLNFSYFIDLGIDEFRYFNVSVYGNNKPITFANVTQQALIMPMRL